MTKVLVRYYSSYGHIEMVTYAVAEGAREAGAEAMVKTGPGTCTAGSCQAGGIQARSGGADRDSERS